MYMSNPTAVRRFKPCSCSVQMPLLQGFCAKGWYLDVEDARHVDADVVLGDGGLRGDGHGPLPRVDTVGDAVNVRDGWQTEAARHTDRLREMSVLTMKR